MAHHKSALKRIRSSEKRRVENRYKAKTMRNAVKKLRLSTDKKESEELLPRVTSLIDRLAKKNVIHKNKASNLKSSLTNKVAGME